MLKIFNTLSRKKEIFKPIYNNNINMYVCGVTVYDFCHIGHGRTFVAFDVIARYLCYLGYNLKYVRNITDIDDKIIKRAHQNGESIDSLTNRMIIEMHKDFDALNIQLPHSEPRVTQHIDEIITFIDKLIKLKHAYIAENGDVMFSISSNKYYGLLSHQNLANLRSKILTEISNTKKCPMDFVLWKVSGIDTPNWLSPWGKGRPGWHIECSAMTEKKLGKKIDIHGGGMDLIFPHHENEIAQSSCIYDISYVNYWVHSGLITINDKKMSKSNGNYFTIRELLLQYDAETIRYFLISSHYRSPINYNKNSLIQAHLSLKRLYSALHQTNISLVSNLNNTIFDKRFRRAMDDDFNTPEALSVLFDIAHEINRLKKNHAEEASSLVSKLYELGKILGLFQKQNSDFFKKIDQKSQIEELVKMRASAREKKDWVMADMIRNKLNEIGIDVSDNIKGTIWRSK
ncbi:cysteine--tRNA ligase [Candidatus Ishikawella capsulata]|uniref:Cysteine--tRNA ligase n=1 Tax=Candidatus Ishikawaella capsulata Mpkobe TaxID=476281 RepID=C5WCN5_9ENTR|nr:cysteine--tRNA ligase [Candidatus Ishikawaella capsulata]BAH83091.1 cysteinyl-tRNA synthetase [Candidatus Ishikawaella capsulata Mpkobe]